MSDSEWFDKSSDHFKWSDDSATKRLTNPEKIILPFTKNHVHISLPAVNISHYLTELTSNS